MIPKLSVFNFSLNNQSDDSIEINIDGYIVDSPTLEIMKDYWGDDTSVSFKSFRESIPQNVKTINLNVNSGGGHVGDAMAMHDYLEALENNGVVVNRKAIGIVASAATYLVMGKNSTISDNCLFMIHNVSGFAYGDVNQVENQAKVMRKFNDVIVNFYASSTGLSKTVIGNMMDAETWLTADETVDKKFISKKVDKVTLTNTIKKEDWLFKNTAMLNTYNSFIKNSDTMDIKAISDAITNGFKALRNSLGIKEEDKAANDAITAFNKSVTDALTNGLKDGNQSEESVQAIVNAAITKAFENVPESYKTAITDATKEFVTKKDVENLLTKKDLETQLENFKTSVVDALAGKAGDKTTGDKNNSGEEGTGTRRIKNRFSGKEYWPTAN